MWAHSYQDLCIGIRGQTQRLIWTIHLVWDRVWSMMVTAWMFPSCLISQGEQRQSWFSIWKGGIVSSLHISGYLVQIVWGVSFLLPLSLHRLQTHCTYSCTWILGTQTRGLKLVEALIHRSNPGGFLRKDYISQLCLQSIALTSFL